MSEDDAGKRLDLDVPERSALGLRKIADLSLGELDILPLPRRQTVDASLDFTVAEPIRWTVQPVEPVG